MRGLIWVLGSDKKPIMQERGKEGCETRVLPPSPVPPPHCTEFAGLASAPNSQSGRRRWGVNFCPTAFGFCGRIVEGQLFMPSDQPCFHAPCVPHRLLSLERGWGGLSSMKQVMLSEENLSFTIACRQRFPAMKSSKRSGNGVRQLRTPKRSQRRIHRTSFFSRPRSRNRVNTPR